MQILNTYKTLEIQSLQYMDSLIIILIINIYSIYQKFFKILSNLSTQQSLNELIFYQSKNIILIEEIISKTTFIYIIYGLLCFLIENIFGSREISSQFKIQNVSQQIFFNLNKQFMFITIVKGGSINFKSSNLMIRLIIYSDYRNSKILIFFNILNRFIMSGQRCSQACSRPHKLAHIVQFANETNNNNNNYLYYYQLFISTVHKLIYQRRLFSFDIILIDIKEDPFFQYPITAEMELETPLQTFRVQKYQYIINIIKRGLHQPLNIQSDYESLAQQQIHKHLFIKTLQLFNVITLYQIKCNSIFSNGLNDACTCCIEHM
ncbi:hypothetical protein pb186bvf_005018 [Paramecium bursaria]